MPCQARRALKWLEFGVRGPSHRHAACSQDRVDFGREPPGLRWPGQACSTGAMRLLMAVPRFTLMRVLCGGAVAGVGSENPYERMGPLTPRSSIDVLVSRRWEVSGIRPAPLCSDAVLVRRVYMDVLGTLPTGFEAEEFLRDTDPDKRARLIERVLARPEFADYWAMKWGDVLRVKAEFPITGWAC